MGRPAMPRTRYSYCDKCKEFFEGPMSAVFFREGLEFYRVEDLKVCPFTPNVFTVEEIKEMRLSKYANHRAD